MAGTLGIAAACVTPHGQTWSAGATSASRRARPRWAVRQEGPNTWPRLQACSRTQGAQLCGICVIVAKLGLSRTRPSPPLAQELFELRNCDLEDLPYRWEGNSGFAGKVGPGWGGAPFAQPSHLRLQVRLAAA